MIPSIISLDVGGTTGIAIQTPDGTLETTTASTMEEMLEILKWHTWDYICVENFTVDHRVDAHGLATIRLVGAVCAYGILFNIPVFVQMPQFRYSSKMEMEAVLSGKHTVIHERDALMHLLAFREKTLPKLEKTT